MSNDLGKSGVNHTSGTSNQSPVSQPSSDSVRLWARATGLVPTELICGAIGLNPGELLARRDRIAACGPSSVAGRRKWRLKVIVELSVSCLLFPSGCSWPGEWNRKCQTRSLRSEPTERVRRGRSFLIWCACGKRLGSPAFRYLSFANRSCMRTSARKTFHSLRRTGGLDEPSTFWPTNFRNGFAT